MIVEHGLQIEYQCFGTGEEVLLCFHGFGRESSDFKPLEITLGERFKIIAINLFHHGNSRFPNNRLEKFPLDRNELELFFELVRTKEKFTRFSLLGYSLGGKVALTLAELYAHEVNHLLLAAPDGIKANPWYYFASQTTLGQRLNKQSITNPWLFTGFIKLSKQFGFASERQVKFAISQMGNAPKRLTVYKIWMTYRRVKPNLNSLAGFIKKHKIQTHVYIGKHERIIPINPIKEFVRDIKSNGQLHLLDCGHQIDFEHLGRVIFENIHKRE